MAEFNIPKHGEICWRELAAKDLPAALEFYSKLFGWDLVQTKVTTMDYKEIQMNDVAYGGMMAIDENWGPVPSHWSTYIAVTNADELLPGEELGVRGEDATGIPIALPESFRPLHLEAFLFQPCQRRGVVARDPGPGFVQGDDAGVPLGVE